MQGGHGGGGGRRKKVEVRGYKEDYERREGREDCLPVHVGLGFVLWLGVDDGLV